MTLKKRLILIVIAVATLPMIFIGTLGYYSAKMALQDLRMEELKITTDLKSKKIEDFFMDQKNHIRTAQLRPNIKKYASLLEVPQAQGSALRLPATLPARPMKPFVMNWTAPLRCTHRFMIMPMYCWQIKKVKSFMF